MPLIKNRMKAIGTSIKENEIRVENLVSRIAELPAEVSAAPIYKKLEELQVKIREEKETKAQLELEKHKANSTDLSEEELKHRLLRAIKALEAAPKAKQRDVFAELLQSAEVHATKLRLAVYTKNDESAGIGASHSNIVSILRGSQSVVGSHTIKNGGVDGTRTRGLPRDRRTL